MFVQAKQAPVDAQSGACGVQELTNLYLAFFRAYSGSGLVIQRLARRHDTPMRAKVARIVSSLTRVAVRPCS